MCVAGAEEGVALSRLALGEENDREASGVSLAWTNRQRSSVSHAATHTCLLFHKTRERKAHFVCGTGPDRCRQIRNRRTGLLKSLSIGSEPVDTNLALGELGFIRRLQHRSDARKVLVGADGGTLNEKLVAAFCLQGRVLLHSLEENW